MTDNRAATEVLGFILAFAIITAAIGIVYTSGFGGLQDVRDDEQLKNVERAFDVLSANIEEVRRFGTPSRSTEIRLRNGRLVLSNLTRIRVEVPAANFDMNVSMRPVSYISNDEDTIITYEGGAVFRASEGQAVMLSEPGWMLEENRLIVPGVVTYQREGPSSLSTAGTALLVAQSFDRVVSRHKSNAPFEVNITVNTTAARAGAWERYFGALTGGSPTTVYDTDPSDGEIKVGFTVESLLVIRAIIGLTLSP